MLRLETILITLERVEVNICYGEQTRLIVRWLSAIDLAPAREAKVTTLNNAFEAIRHLKSSCPDEDNECWRDHEWYCFSIDRDSKFRAKCKSLRTLTLRLDITPSQLFQLLAHATPETDLSTLLRDTTYGAALLDLTSIQTLASLHIIVNDFPMFLDDDYPIVKEAKSKCWILVAWLAGEYKQLGSGIKVTFSYATQKAREAWEVRRGK